MNDGSEPPLVETVYCPDIFATGIARVERVGGECVRLILYAEQENEAGQIERVIVCKLVRPIKTLIVNDKLLALVKEHGARKGLN
jgi:hypothetical protein